MSGEIRSSENGENAAGTNATVGSQSINSSNVHKLDALLSHICALEIQNFKILKCLDELNMDDLVGRLSHLEERNKSLVDKLIAQKPDITIHEEKEEGKMGYVNIDFSSDDGLELECFGLSKISPISHTYPPSTNQRSSRRRSSTTEKKSKHGLSDTSRYSLANRLSLDWGDKNGARPHSIGRPSFDAYKGPVRQSIDVAINSMRLSISKPLVEKDVKCNFLEFCVVGVKRGILNGSVLPDIGRQDTEILENYPQHKEPLIPYIADFAFPKKAMLYMTDSLRQAEIMCERNRDQYNVFQFSDNIGTPTFACCLIVTEAIPLHVRRHARTIKGLKHLEYLERCVSIIKRFLRYAISNDIVIKRQVITNNDGKVVGYLTSAVKLSDVGKGSEAPLRTMESQKGGKFGSSLSKLKDNMKSRLKKGHDPNSPMDTSPSPGDRKMWIPKRHQKNKMKADECLGGVFDDLNAEPESSDEDNEDTSKERTRAKSDSDKKLKSSASQSGPKSGTIALKSKSITSQSPVIVKSPSPSLLSPGKSMTKPSTISGGASNPPKKKSSYEPPEWKYVVTQRAYCLLSAKPMHAFLFQILEEIAAREKKRCGAIYVSPPMSEAHGTLTAQRRKRSRSLSRNLTVVMEDNDEDDEEDDDVGGQAVDATTKTMNALAKIDINGPDDGVGGGSFHLTHRDKRNEFLQYVQSHPLTPNLLGPDISLSCPQYLPHRVSVPSVMIALEEWAGAALLSIIQPQTVLRLLNMLILEKSLIVYGQNVSMVTAVTIAIAGFLKPFQWQGVFIPLVPSTAMEILGAPVPFIVGTCCEFSKSEMSPNAAILNLDAAFHTSTEDVLELPDVTVMMPLDQELRSTLSTASKILSERLPDSNLHQLQLSTFFSDLTEAEKNAVHDVMTAIEQHNILFCGDLVVADSWRRYGTYDPSSGDFEFYPQWFLDHQRSVLEFQDVVVHTQLFVSFVDKLRTDYVEKTFQRLFISDWVYFRHMLRKKWRRQKTDRRDIVKRRHS